MRQISAPDLAQWLADPARPRPILLDVREPSEYEICHIPEARLIPMRTIPLRLTELPREAEIVAICHHGGRSMQVAMFLEQQGYGAVYNLVGGVNAWALSVDPKMPCY
ncbi:MAG: hypothetical protein RIR00_1967 [Pseudomonadota bacterium]|jgi:rhodanese-related sulfurtransferase